VNLPSFAGIRPTDVPSFRAAQIVGARLAFFVSLAHVKDRLKQGNGVFESGLGNRRQIAQILGKHLVRCWAGSRCYRYGRNRELVAKAAAESVYSGVGVRRGVAKVGHKWGKFVLCWCGWQTVGSAPDENRVSVSRPSETGVVWRCFQRQKGNSGSR
jgi:hypothetical protein